MKLKKILSVICTAAIILSSLAIMQITSFAVKEEPIKKIIDFTTFTDVRHAGPQLNAWQCGNGDAIGGELPFFGDWGLNGLWGHISVKKTDSGLVLENNGADGNPATLRYTIGGDHIGGSGVEIPVDSYLNVKAVATEKFNIVIPFRFGSLEDAAKTTGFITLKNVDGVLTAVNEKQDTVYTSLIDAGTVNVRVPLKDILSNDGSKSYTTARLYALDYITDPAVKAYKTTFNELAIETGTASQPETKPDAGDNGNNPVKKVADFMNATDVRHEGPQLNAWQCGNGDAIGGELPFFGDWGLNGLWGHISVNKTNDGLVIENNGADGNPAVVRYTLGGDHIGGSGVEVPVDSYLNIKATASEKFNVVIPFRFGTAEEAAATFGFITLKNVDGVLTAVNEKQDTVYTSLLDAGTVSARLSLNDILTNDGAKDYNSVRLYAVDYITNPDVKAFKTVFTEFAIETGENTDPEGGKDPEPTPDPEEKPEPETKPDAGDEGPVAKVEDFMNATDVRHEGPQLNAWQCGNGDAPLNPFSGDYGLNALWGHITVVKTEEGLAIENNGADGNPAVIRYTLGGDQLNSTGVEVPVNSYLNIKAVATEKFNIIIPYRYGSAEEAATTFGFITLKNVDGVLTAVNENQDTVYTSLIDAGTVNERLSLKDILANDGTKDYNSVRLYAVDYITNPDVKAFKTVFSEFAIETGKTEEVVTTAPVVSGAAIGEIKGLVDNINNVITFTVPFGSSVKALEPVFTFKGDMKATANITGAQDFTKPVTYEFTAPDGTKSTYKVIVVINALPDGNAESYTFDINPENWVKIQGADDSEAELSYKNGYLEVKNAGGHWLNVGYKPLLANDFKLDLNKAPYLFYDVTDTAEYWNIIVVVKDSEGRASELNVNRYLAYKVGKDNGWDIKEDGGFINFKSHRRFGSFAGKLDIADMIKWGKETGSIVYPEGATPMDAAPADGILTIDAIILHTDAGQNAKNKSMLVRTLAFDNEKGSHIPTYTAVAGSHDVKFATDSIGVIHPDSTAQVGEATFANNVLKLQKLGDGWVNFVVPMTESINVNAYDSKLSTLAKADDVFRMFITVNSNKGTSLHINVTQYMQSLKNSGNDYAINGEHNFTYSLIDLIKFQAGINKVDYKDYISSNGVVSIGDFEFSMEGKGNKNLTLTGTKFITSGVEGSSPATGNTASPFAAAAIVLISLCAFAVIGKKVLDK